MAATTRADILACQDELLNVQDQAAAPSKNFFQLIVNKLGVVLRLWLINPGVALHHREARTSTQERTCTLNEFVLGDLHEDISRVDPALLNRALKVVEKYLEK